MKKYILFIAAWWIFHPGMIQAQFRQETMETNQHLAAGNPILYVGTFSVRGSEGIYVYEFDLTTGETRLVETVPGKESPSFLTIHPNRDFLYAVTRQGPDADKNWGGVVAFAIDHATGKLQMLNEASALGAGACHVNTDETGKMLFVSNYSEGSFSAYSVLASGEVGDNLANFPYVGKGPNAGRQEKPHIHSAMPSPDNKYVYVADLGTDKLWTYRIKPSKGKLKVAKPAWSSVEAGSGPRHFTFHPNGKWVYVAEELTSTVTALTYQSKSGKLDQFQRLSTLPADFKENSYCADIHLHPNGKFLYVSNRGHNSLAIFSVDPESGKLTLIDTPSVLGKWPRNFMITPDGKWCLVANEHSDNVVFFSIDQYTGILKATGREMKIPSPVCLKLLLR